VVVVVVVKVAAATVVVVVAVVKGAMVKGQEMGSEGETKLNKFN